MAHKVWTFTIRGSRHTVELEHGYLSGKACITVDGEQIERSRKIGVGSVHKFQVSGVPCVLEIIESGIQFYYELLVAGKPVYGEKERIIYRSVKRGRRRSTKVALITIFLVSLGLGTFLFATGNRVGDSISLAVAAFVILFIFFFIGRATVKGARGQGGNGDYHFVGGDGDGGGNGDGD